MIKHFKIKNDIAWVNILRILEYGEVGTIFIVKDSKRIQYLR